MNDEKIGKDKIYALLREVNNVAVLPSPDRGDDAFYAAAGLFYMVKEIHKNVSFICTENLPDRYLDVIKKEEITSDIGQRSLIVSIDYSNTEASKVNYYTQQNVLYVKISPIAKDYNKDEKIRSKLTGFDFDLIFVVGAKNLLSLGDAYKNLDTISKISKIVNIDNSKRNERYGFVNVVDPSSANLSLLILQKSPLWGVKVNTASAKSLLKGISTINL